MTGKKRLEIDQFITQFDNGTVKDLPTISFGTENFDKNKFGKITKNGDKKFSK